MDSVVTIAGTVIGVVFGGGVLWGAIRADIRNMHESITTAHQRIDTHLQGHG